MSKTKQKNGSPWFDPCIHSAVRSGWHNGLSIENSSSSYRWNKGQEKLVYDPGVLAAISVLNLTKSASRRAVGAALIQCHPDIDVWQVAGAAIDSDDASVMEDMKSFMPMDVSDGRYACVAAALGRDKSLAWLITQNASVIGPSGMPAAGWATREAIKKINDNMDTDVSHHKVALALCAPEILVSLSSSEKSTLLVALSSEVREAREEALRAIKDKGRDTNYDKKVWITAKEHDKRSQVLTAFVALWRECSVVEKVAAPAACWELCWLRIDPAWKTVAHDEGVMGDLIRLARDELWGPIEKGAQKAGWSLGQALVTWVSKLKDHDSSGNWWVKNTDVQQGWAELDVMVGRPAIESEYLFSDMDGSVILPCSDYKNDAGPMLMDHLKRAGQNMALVDIKTVLGHYAALCGECASIKRESPGGSPKRSKSKRSDYLQERLSEFDSHLKKMYDASDENEEMQRTLNRIANEWGSLRIDANLEESFYQAWCDKLEMVAAASCTIRPMGVPDLAKCRKQRL